MRGSRADVTRPNWADDTLLFGALKLTLLKMLKNSARNCMPTFSVTFVTFSNATSVLKYPGPRTMFLPELPKVPIAFGTNFEVSKYCATVSPWERLPRSAVPPRKSARSRLMPVNELSRPLLIVKGKPLCQVTIEFSIQPLTTLLRTRSPPTCGSCQTFDSLKLCGTSSRETP